MPLLMASLAYFHYDVYDPESHPINQKQLRRQYDFIVVGGGSAGAVLANRLSEIPHWTVLLLEAGPDENEISDVPSLSAYLQLSKLDWQYKTEPTGKLITDASKISKRNVSRLSLKTSFVKMYRYVDTAYFKKMYRYMVR